MARCAEAFMGVTPPERSLVGSKFLNILPLSAASSAAAALSPLQFEKVEARKKSGLHNGQPHQGMRVQLLAGLLAGLLLCAGQGAQANYTTASNVSLYLGEAFAVPALCSAALPTQGVCEYRAFDMPSALKSAPVAALDGTFALNTELDLQDASNPGVVTLYNVTVTSVAAPSFTVNALPPSGGRGNVEIVVSNMTLALSLSARIRLLHVTAPSLVVSELNLTAVSWNQTLAVVNFISRLSYALTNASCSQHGSCALQPPFFNASVFAPLDALQSAGLVVKNEPLSACDFQSSPAGPSTFALTPSDGSDLAYAIATLVGNALQELFCDAFVLNVLGDGNSTVASRAPSAAPLTSAPTHSPSLASAFLNTVILGDSALPCPTFVAGACEFRACAMDAEFKATLCSTPYQTFPLQNEVDLGDCDTYPTQFTFFNQSLIELNAALVNVTRVVTGSNTTTVTLRVDALQLKLASWIRMQRIKFITYEGTVATIVTASSLADGHFTLDGTQGALNLISVFNITNGTLVAKRDGSGNIAKHVAGSLCSFRNSPAGPSSFVVAGSIPALPSGNVYDINEMFAVLLRLAFEDFVCNLVVANVHGGFGLAGFSSPTSSPASQGPTGSPSPPTLVPSRSPSQSPFPPSVYQFPQAPAAAAPAVDGVLIGSITGACAGAALLLAAYILAFSPEAANKWKRFLRRRAVARGEEEVPTALPVTAIVTGRMMSEVFQTPPVDAVAFEAAEVPRHDVAV